MDDVPMTAASIASAKAAQQQGRDAFTAETGVALAADGTMQIDRQKKGRVVQTRPRTPRGAREAPTS